MSEAPAPLAARTRGHPAQQPDVRLRTGWLRQANPPSPPAAGKAIVILCDGTSNDPEQMDGGERVPTNVFRLYQALSDPTQFGGAQIAWYDPGVGTDTSRVSKRVGLVARLAQRLVAALPTAFPVIARKAQMLLEAATGASIRENIEQGYREIVRLYEPGDRIYLFGFSRGAYTARCIAGVIDRCGLLRRERLGSAAAAVSLYLRRPRDRGRGAPRQPLLDAGSIHPDGSVKVHVLGLWDTVAALGLPLWGWWFRIGELWRNKSFDSDPASVCEFVYHGLAMDETRSQFFPTLTTAREPGPHPRIRQLWFRGAHADVGGGYRERELSEIPLEWMLQVARHHGLKLRPVAARGGTAESGVLLEPRYGLPVCAGSGVRQELGEIHSEVARRPGWQAFGTWPRWTPALRPGTAGLAGADGATGFGLLHASVYARAEYAHWRWARRVAATPAPADPSPLVDHLMARDGMVFLDAGDSVRLRVLAAQPWNRSGVVFEQDALYSIAFVEGAWSAGGAPCGPEGTTDGLGGWLRRLAGGRRLALVGHIAHPRPWPVEEFSFAKLLRFVLIGDPRPLVQSLLPLGRCLGEAAARRTVYVVNLAENGLFHAFANAGWLAYDGHDGALDIRVTRLAGPPPACWR